MQLTRKLILLLFFFVSFKGHAQNLFANPGFEDINICVEYHAACAPEAWFNIPATNYLVKGLHAQKPVLGHMLLLVPVANVMANFNNKRRFIYSILTCPMTAGERYILSFFLHTAGKPFEKLDFYFSDKEPTLSNFNVVNKTPSFTITSEHIDDDFKLGWKHVQYTFTADANHGYCVIGNFSALDQKYEMKDAMNSAGDIFYFIDEILLKPVSGNISCVGYEDNIRKMYAQNYRHTDDIIVVKDKPVEVKKPEFRTDTIVIPSVLFDLNNASIKPAIGKILDSVLNKISKLKVAKIDINGHTDNTGSVVSNEALSLSRAESVRRYLAERSPGFSERLFVSGKGQHFPVEDNNTESGRRRNRRVEIILTVAVLPNDPGYIKQR
jgi:outer membrane protein OmpA-like peptidoglycan-associated protein